MIDQKALDKIIDNAILYELPYDVQDLFWELFELHNGMLHKLTILYKELLIRYNALLDKSDVYYKCILIVCGCIILVQILLLIYCVVLSYRIGRR